MHFFTFTKYFLPILMQNSSTWRNEYWAGLQYLLILIHGHWLSNRVAYGRTPRNCYSKPDRSRRYLSLPKRPDWLCEPFSIIFDGCIGGGGWGAAHHSSTVSPNLSRQAMFVWRNIVMGSLKHHCNKSSPIQFVCFSTLCHGRHNFKEMVTENKMRVLIFSTNFVWNISYSKMSVDIITNANRSSC